MQITMNAGDVFTFKDGSGVVIGDMALLVTKEDNRMGPNISLGEIPSDAFPAQLQNLRWDSQMAIRGALVSNNLPVPVSKD